MAGAQTTAPDGDRGLVPPARRSLYVHCGLALILGLLGFATISGCLTAPFIHLDDTIYVTENPLLKPDQPWSRLVTEHVYYQRIPVTMASYRLNAALFGLDAAWSFRLVNWLLHVVSALLLLKVLERLGVGRWAALAVAMIWVVHPMACESVAWVSQRRNVLGFFFGISALYSYVRWYGKVVGWVVSPIAFAAALFSSPLALGWLPIFVALEVLGGPEGLSRAGGERMLRPSLRSLIGLVPLVLLAAFVVWTGISGYARTLRPPPGGSVFTALLTDTELFLRYVLSALIPARLSVMYGVDAIESPGDPRLWANVAVWGLLIAGTIWAARSRRRAVFGWLWFFGALGPASNIVAIGYPMQDRYVYVSLVGLLLVLTESVAGLAGRVGSRSSSPSSRSAGFWLLRAPLPLYICFLAVLTVRRSASWSDSLELMERAVEAQPAAALSHIFYARQLVRVADELRFEGKGEAACEVNRRAARHLEEGMERPDAYLFNPLYAKILLAGHLADAGESRRAIELLEGELPAHDAPRTEFSNGPPCFTFVASRFAFTYTLSSETAASGYRNLARAYLHEFSERPLPYDEARRLLKKASVNGFIALKIVPGLPESQSLCACILLAGEPFEREGAPQEKALEEARARARLSEPELRLLSRIPAVREDLRTQLSGNRLRALGSIGMARAQFEPLLRKNCTPDEIRRRFDGALQWVRRAGELDPTLGESFLYMARIQHFLFEAARAQGDEALMERQRQACIDALRKVPASSACYPRAQENLRALGAGPAQSEPFGFE